MGTSRYNHCAVYDERRMRIYVFGGLGDIQGMGSQALEQNERDKLPFFLKKAEYYDLRTD